ncbi:DUF418 domain-containing protein [Promicromonospora sp. NPDC060204]|uniref:DUF418 domain-containing protein n=1 Tax=Promicromonospora sp. NPDC060204 TaxID=3347071 RepID=UPI00365002C6
MTTAADSAPRSSTRPADPGLEPHAAPRARGPVLRAERALAPDLARGAMLLLIALANSVGYFFANAPGLDPTPHGAERPWIVLLFLFVHSRAFPLFAFLFGYGLVQLAARQDAAGASPAEVRRILVRRNAWLLAFGAAHGLLLNAGDFLGAYGLVGIAFTLLLLRRSTRVYRFVPVLVALEAAAALVLAVLVTGRLLSGGLVGAADAVPSPTSPMPSVLAPTFLDSVAARLGEWPAHTATVLPFILFVWIGAWAARRRILEEPGEHLTLLRRGAVGGLAIGALGGLPMGLLAAGWLHLDAGTAGLVTVLYNNTGTLGAIGWTCLFGLLAHRIARARAGAATGTTDGAPGAEASGRLVDAVAALGRRSLTGYLVQSVAWVVLTAPFLLDLPRHAPSPTFAAAGSAVAVWALTVVGAAALERRGNRGPAENLLRRLTYGRR